MKWAEFHDLYSTNVRQLYKTENLKEWQRFVENCNDEVLKDAVYRIADICASQKEQHRTLSSSLGDLKAQYKKMLHDKGFVRGSNGPDCSICGNTGLVLVVQVGGSYGPLCNPRKPHNEDSNSLGLFSAPCTCKRGDRHSDDFTMESRERCVSLRFTDRIDPQNADQTKRWISAEDMAYDYIFKRGVFGASNTNEPQGVVAKREMENQCG